MSDAGGNTNSNPAPTGWFSTLDEVNRGHVASKGWDKLAPELAAAEIAKAHREAQMALTRVHGIPHDQIARIPERPDDAAGWNDLYKRLGKPEKPEEYKIEGLKFADGSDPDEGFIGAMRQIAHDLNLPAHLAPQLTAKVMALADAEEKAGTTRSQATVGAADAALRQSWGAQHDYFNFQVGRTMDVLGMPAEIMEFARAAGPESYVKFMGGMRGLAAKMGEAELLRGDTTHRAGPPAYTREQAQARIDELKADRGWVAKWVGGDANAKREFDELFAIIAGPAPQQANVR